MATSPPTCAPGAPGGYRYWVRPTAAAEAAAAEAAAANPPKPLTASEAAALTAAATAPATGASLWNAAGTWEDRDCTAAAKRKMAARLVGLRAGGVTITALPSISGDASLALVRGACRAGFDFEVTLEWEGQAASTGTAHIPNCASDELEDLSVVEVKATGEGAAPPRGLAPALAGAVGAALEGLAGELVVGGRVE